MSKRFPLALKLKMLDRMRGVNAVSAAQLSRETGITQQSLSRWLRTARSLPLAAFGNDVVSSWTVEQKARILAQAGSLAGEMGCYPHPIKIDALASSGDGFSFSPWGKHLIA